MRGSGSIASSLIPCTPIRRADLLWVPHGASIRADALLEPKPRHGVPFRNSTNCRPQTRAIAKRSKGTVNGKSYLQSNGNLRFAYRTLYIVEG